MSSSDLVQNASLTITVTADTSQADPNLAALQQKIKETAEETAALSDAEKEQAATSNEANRAMAEKAAQAADAQAKLNQEIAQTKQTAQNGFTAVTAGIDIMISGIVKGHETMRQVTTQAVETMVIDFLKGQVKMQMSAIEAQLGITSATQTGVAARKAAQDSGASSGVSADASAAKQSIGTNAASAAAAVYNDVAQIPVVGWLLAPPAAAAYTAVSAFGGMIPGLEVGAWEIPQPMLALLHPGESVVPANFASGLRSSGMLSGGGGSAASSGGSTAVTFQVSALDAASVQSFFNANAATLARTVANAQARNPSIGR